MVKKTRISAARFMPQRFDAGYERERDLPRLLPLLAEDLETRTLEAHRNLVNLLKRALRGERMRAHLRHWAYDPARHAALARAARTEAAALRRRAPNIQ